MNLLTVRNYLEPLLPVKADWFGVAHMDTRRARAMCLYGLPIRTENGVRIGGLDCTGYKQKRMTLVMRLGTDASAAEDAALAVHAALDMPQVALSGTTGFMRVLDAEPYQLGADAHGVFEFRVDFELFYEWDNVN